MQTYISYWKKCSIVCNIYFREMYVWRMLNNNEVGGSNLIVEMYESLDLLYIGCCVQV